jgi:hypothetical protein
LGGDNTPTIPSMTRWTTCHRFLDPLSESSSLSVVVVCRSVVSRVVNLQSFHRQNFDGGGRCDRAQQQPLPPPPRVSVTPGYLSHLFMTCNQTHTCFYQLVAPVKGFWFLAIDLPARRDEPVRQRSATTTKTRND